MIYAHGIALLGNIFIGSDDIAGECLIFAFGNVEVVLFIEMIHLETA